MIGVGDVTLNHSHWQQIRQLADCLNAPLLATQPVIQQGKLPRSQLLGISGQNIDCDYYLALGISGSMQHMSGIHPETTIIAVNRDPKAMIFSYAKVKWVVDISDALAHLIGQIFEPKAQASNHGD